MSLRVPRDAAAPVDRGSQTLSKAVSSMTLLDRVKAGEPAVGPNRGQVQAALSTINIILVTNARLSSSALVGAVQVATESKTAVLLSKNVPSWTGSPGATGTGTDAVVIACGTGPVLRYSGTHTKIGEMIGRLVQRGVTKGLVRPKHSKPQHVR